MTGTDPAAHVPAHPTRHALTDPRLTGMSRDALDTLLEKLIVPYAAAIEQRHYRQRGETDAPAPAAESSASAADLLTSTNTPPKHPGPGKPAC
ncbi:hypothetical protein GCM10023191_078660 [Actinoallomurus oryzae]|uniref:Uncharacterized protein n=1 Tax=Actinoallomurus oryzae TaxID=502180 RepID=A0ABP8QXI9_9ACTN